jgi:hypothetical protein
MSSLVVCLLSIVCIVTGTLLGFALQRYLPSHHLTKDSHDSVKLASGIIATLTALVLGLLVSAAKDSFDTVNQGIVQSGAKLILLDRVLAQYGPESKGVRDALRQTIEGGIQTIWSDEAKDGSALLALEKGEGIEPIQVMLRGLTPSTDSQRELLTQAKQIAAEASQARWLAIEHAQAALPTTFLVILVCWLTVLFASFGLYAPRNKTVLTAFIIGAVSVSAAIFLILEMNRPLEGFMKISSAPLRKALELLGR